MWQQIKLHFEEAYEQCLASGQGTASSHGYVNNMMAEDDQDSITTIQESLTNIHMANNANYANLQEHLQAARSETAALCVELAATQQIMANITQATMRTHVPPPVYAPPIFPKHIHAPQTYVAPPTSLQQYGPRSPGGRGNNACNTHTWKKKKQQ